MFHIPEELKDIFLQVAGKNYLKKHEWEEFISNFGMVTTSGKEGTPQKNMQKTALPAQGGTLPTEAAQAGTLKVPGSAGSAGIHNNHTTLDIRWRDIDLPTLLDAIVMYSLSS